MRINNVQMPNFSKDEFSEDPDLYAHPEMLFNLQVQRTKWGHPFVLSKAQGALARFDDKAVGSQHYAMNRYSTAIDGFPQMNIFKAWSMALNSGLWGGIGVYFDTKNNRGVEQPMLHLDTRERFEPTLWYRDKGKYVYRSDKSFYTKLIKIFYEKQLNAVKRD